MDFPIDPALLAEEAEMADADGEVDGDYEVEDYPVEVGYPMAETYTASPRRGRPSKQPVASTSRLSATPSHPLSQPKKRGPKPGSRRSNSAISKSKLNHINGNGNGNSNSHSLPTITRTSSVETTYVQVPLKGDKFCSFCAGTKKRNKLGEPEKMVSCSICRQSGHPTCLNMYGRLAKTVFTYDWVCLNCKVCEFCAAKGNDDDMMFCDGCDKGYHYYCCDPPLPGVPKGKFLCVACRKAVEARRLQKASFSLPNVRHPPDPSIKYHPPPHAETPTIARRGRPPKSLQASRLAQLASQQVDDDDLFTARPRIKIKGRDKGKGRQVDDSPGFVVKIRVPSGGRSKTVDIEDEEEKIPYGGVITGDDADTSKTTITDFDKERFEKSYKAAESRLGGPPPILADYDPHLSMRGSPAPSSVNGFTPRGTTPNLSKSTSASTPMLARGLRDRILQQTISGTPATPSTPNGLAVASGSKNGTVASSSEKIKTIRFGPFDIDTWYSAPYPEEYQNVPDGRLWLCEFCLKYMKSGFVAGRHRTKCKTRHPPGDEIYRDGNISVFEVDGRKNKIYCQNLCLLAKMFLDHKTLYYDVEPFLFYVMTEVDELGARFVGYFSKEKRSIDNNVSCIMTLPVRQRKGWGQLLIDFSYALSKKEGRVGSPEKPLSGLGEVTYKRYWKIKVFEHLRNAPDTLTMDEISSTTSLTLDDIYSTLVSEDMITSLDSPTPTYSTHTPSRGRGRRGRGRASAQRRSSHREDHNAQNEADEPSDKPPIPKRYAIKFDKAYIEAVLDQYESKGHLTLNFDRLKYHPFLVSRDPVKPPGTIAKTTLMSNQADADADGEEEVEPEEIINHGEDRATLDLVAKLAEVSPVRSLRKRPASTSAPNSADSKRPRRARSSLLNTPRRSTRGGTLGQGVESPLRARAGAVLDEDGEWDEDLDAEGEEYVEDEE